MKKIVTFCVILFVFLACASPEEEEKIETGRVVGTVFDKETGNTRGGVNVCIGYVDPGGRSHSISSYVIGSDGMYSFDNIEPFSKTHCATINYVWVQGAPTSGRGVTVIAGQTTTADISY